MNTALLYIFLFLLIFCLSGAYSSLLDDYVNSHPAFVKWELLPEFNLNGTGKAFNKDLTWTAQAVNVTSQKWLTEEDWGADWGGEGAQWWHLVYIITPSEIKTPGPSWTRCGTNQSSGLGILARA